MSNRIDDYLKTGQAAREIGISIQTVIRWADRGMVRSYRLPIGNRERRVHMGDIRRLIAECSNQPKEGASDVVDAPE